MSRAKKLENTANVIIIVLAIVLSATVVKKYFLPSPVNESAKAGEKVSIKELDFNKAEKTVLVALQPNCPFCGASANFYRELRKQTTSDKNIRLVALFSPEVTDERKYLSSLNVDFDKVKKLPYDKIKIQATPTILVIKPDGTIESVWVGKLSAEKEKDFFAKLF